MGMKGFKGFEKDFSCRGKQYEENTTYEEHGEKIKEDTYYTLENGEFVEV